MGLEQCSSGARIVKAFKKGLEPLILLGFNGFVDIKFPSFIFTPSFSD